MAVNFRFVKNNGKTSPNFIHGCFGTLMSKCIIPSTNPDRSVSEYDIRKYNYLEYFQYSDPFQNVLVKTLQEDTAFKLKIFRQITNQFPWMKEVIKVRYSDGNTLLNNQGAIASRYTLVAKLDLSKPADTVWFCLNTVRLIQQCDYSEKFEKVIESGVDFWKSIVVCNSAYYSRSWDGKNGNWYYYDLEETCLLSMAYMSEEVIKAVLEDPIQVLNKLPSVIESKSGFLLECKERDYSYVNPVDRKTINNPFKHRFTRNIKDLNKKDVSVHTLNGIEAYWSSIEVMNGTHEIDTIPKQSDSICREYKGFRDLKEWYLFCGLSEESFDKLFINYKKTY